MEDNKLTTIGSKEVNPTQLSGIMQEEKVNEAIRKQALRAVVKPFRTQLRSINVELNKGRTLEELIQEVNDKKSKLPRSTRDVLTNMTEEGIERLLTFMREEGTL